jgi:hypothetical protein
MEKENLYSKIQEALGNLKGTFSVLEEQIDIDVQLEYFESSKDSKKRIDIEDTWNNREDLFSEVLSIDQKKSLLVKLAGIDKVEAYRVLERYKQNPDPELKDWASLAMHESRMLLESSLLDENQVFISTGLGGKGQKLRYFIVFLSKEDCDLGELEKKVITNEIRMMFNKHNAEIEEIKFSHNLTTVKAVIPIQIELNEMFEQFIENCNMFGDFLQMNFIVTNVKELSFEEIRDVLKKSKVTGKNELR